MAYPMAPESVVWDEASREQRSAILAAAGRDPLLVQYAWRELIQPERDALRDEVMRHYARESGITPLPGTGRVHDIPTAWAGASARPRPTQRGHVISAFKLHAANGDYKVHVSISRYDDGAPLEIFVDLAKEGSTTQALMGAICRQVSRGWQHGVPASDTVDQFMGTRFEPSGRCEGHPAVDGVYCTSLLDALARVIAHEFSVKVHEGAHADRG